MNPLHGQRLLFSFTRGAFRWHSKEWLQQAHAHPGTVEESAVNRLFFPQNVLGGSRAAFVSAA